MNDDLTVAVAVQIDRLNARGRVSGKFSATPIAERGDVVTPVDEKGQSASGLGHVVGKRQIEISIPVQISDSALERLICFQLERRLPGGDAVRRAPIDASLRVA